VGKSVRGARLDDTGTVMSGRPDPNQSSVSGISAYGSHLISSHWLTPTGNNTLKSGELMTTVADMAGPNVVR